MASNLKLSIVTANAIVNAVVALLPAGKLRIYAGTQPATPETAITTQTLLAEKTLATPAFGSPSSGVATAGTVGGTATALATGTAAWCRFVESDGSTVVCDGSVGTSGCDVNLDTVSLEEGGTVTITGGTLTMPRSA